LREIEDQELRDLFQDLREEERKGVPSFEILMERAKEEASRSGLELPLRYGRGRRVPRSFAWGGSLLVAAAAAVVLFLRLPGTSDSEFVQVVQSYTSDPAAGAWKSPTDGLLDLPGSEILSTVPSIGTGRWLLDSGAPPQRNDL
jgi:hypothetical protein